MSSPVIRKVEKPVHFTPFQGLMAVARRVAGVIESRTGVELWSGADGLEGVTADILRGLGVPDKVNLGGDGRAISPRVVAQKCGLLPRKNSRKAVR